MGELIDMAAKLSTANMIGTFVTIVVGIALVPVLYSIIVTANVTDPATAAMISLVPLVFVIGIVLYTVTNLV
jgi:hypothetical protein